MTYPPLLCAALARSTMLTMRALRDPDVAVYPDDLLDPDSALEELMAFYVSWDPYGDYEVRRTAVAMDTRNGRRCRCDPEKHRFQAPGHDVTQKLPDDSAPAAPTEQAFADALDDAGVLPEAPPPLGPPPPALTAEQVARIAANREAARARKAARLQAARAARHQAVAPWVAQGLRFNF